MPPAAVEAYSGGHRAKPIPLAGSMRQKAKAETDAKRGSEAVAGVERARDRSEIRLSPRRGRDL